jgi:hypothetical protein
MGGYVAVDLDGTLAQYDGWRGIGVIGEPVPAMLTRVMKWIEEGREVKIFTARAGTDEGVRAVREWLIKHKILQRNGLTPTITNVKDFEMVELWDDRCVRVRPNTGEPCCNYVR